MPDLHVPAGENDFLTRPIVQLWEGLLRRAVEKKQGFSKRADQIMTFYSGGPDAMWSPQYAATYMGGATKLPAPKFAIQANVAFEQVAIFGPLLFWEMADRKVSAYKSLQLDPNILAGGNPEAQQYFESLAQQQAMQDARNAMRAQLFEPILNYFQREQPGTLSVHSELAVFEALTMGAGFLRTEHYRYPFSERTLVRSNYQPARDVYVDPDCQDALWESADWVAIGHWTKWSELELMFDLPPGSMLPYCTSTSQSAANQAPSTKPDDISKDLVRWYEVFSRAGFGNRLAGTKQVIAPEFDQMRGAAMVGGKMVRDEFVYLAICPKCAYPLNMPQQVFSSEESRDEEWIAAWVKKKTSWPTEFWRDNKWPIEMLSFYWNKGTNPWPEASLSSCIGELTCINILMSAYIQSAWEGRQSIIAHRKNAIQNLQALKTSSESPLMVELDPAFDEKLEDCIQFLQREPVNKDLLEAIMFMQGQIEKRTGLSPEMYGRSSGANPRSATEYQGRADTVNIRPDFMRKKVAAFQSRVADKEVFCAYSHVRSSDIADQLGPLGVAAWDMLVTTENPEAILRSSKCFVEASSIRRPNKQKDTDDLKEMQQYLLPILAGQMAQTGDVGPINGFIASFGDAAEIDVTPFMFPEPQADPINDEMKALTLEKLKAEIQKMQADATKSMADAEAVGSEGEVAMQDAQVKAQSAEHDAMLKAQVAEHSLTVKEREAQMKLAAQQQEMVNKQDEHQLTMEQRQQEARQAMGLELMKALQGMQVEGAKHQQTAEITDEKARDDVRRSNMITSAKLLNMRAERAIQNKGAQS